MRLSASIRLSMIPVAASEARHIAAMIAMTMDAHALDEAERWRVGADRMKLVACRSFALVFCKQGV